MGPTCLDTPVQSWCLTAAHIGRFHLFKVADRQLLFDPVSLCAIGLDSPAFALLRALQHWAENAPAASHVPTALLDEWPDPSALATLAEVDALVQEGVVGLPDPRSSHADPGFELGYAVLQIAHACNLACTYCFADGGDYGEGATLMSPEAAREVVDFLWPHFGANDMHLGFFGGEPLLNFPVLRQVVEYVERRAATEKRGCRFSITTNATLLSPEIRDFLEAHAFTVIVSHDGPAPQHNAFRILNNGDGSHARVEAGLEQLRGTALAQRTTLRATFTKAETAIVDRSEHLNGLIDRSVAGACSVEFACMTSSGCADNAQDALQLTETDLPRVKAEYTELAERYVAAWQASRPYRLFYFDRLIQTLATRTAVVRSCSAGQHYVTVDPVGRIFACHKEGHSQIGTIQQGFDAAARAPWAANTLFDRNHCRSCWARYQCGGGCRFHHESVNGDPNEPWNVECEMQRHLVELTIWIMAQLPVAAIDRIARTKFADGDTP